MACIVARMVANERKSSPGTHFKTVKPHGRAKRLQPCKRAKDSSEPCELTIKQLLAWRTLTGVAYVLELEGSRQPSLNPS